ncbi:MAG: hypothetical protein U0326_00785 [Polyangiales bacterium]
MMVRIRTIASALALCAAVIAPAARAQTVAEHDNRAPAEPAAPVANAEPGELDAPPVPAVPEALQARVDALASVVESTEECFTYHGERSEHIADPACGRWYASLQRGGSAAAHAIGLALMRPEGAEHNLMSVDGSEQRGPRLMQVLAATRAPEAVPYMLNHLADVARRDTQFWELEREILRQLGRVAGDDPMPVAPWERNALNTADARRRVVTSWIRWWRAHGADTPAQRAAAIESHALGDLNAEDPAVRFAAIQRLATNPVHGPAATASLRDLLARRDLPARAAVYIRRWAQRTHVSIAAPVTVASNAAVAPR